MRRDGFTLLEVLVASLLMGMLVTILTMIFNQSSIAWRTGRANVSDLAEITQRHSVCQYVADNAIPFLGDGKRYCVVSPWKDAALSGNASASLYSRGIATVGDLQGNQLLPFDPKLAFEEKTVDGIYDGLGSGTEAGVRTYVVGVKSAGPDGIFDDEGDSEDDISTWPDGIE